MENLCVLCRKEEDIIFHLLIHCPYQNDMESHSPYVFYNIWKETNNHIFRKKISSPKVVFQIMMGLIKECGLIWKWKLPPHSPTQMDNFWQKMGYLTFMEKLDILRAQERMGTKWCHSQELMETYFCVGYNYPIVLSLMLHKCHTSYLLALTKLSWFASRFTVSTERFYSLPSIGSVYRAHSIIEGDCSKRQLLSRSQG